MSLKKLHIKWGAYKDISKISNLQNLQYLDIGSGAGVESIEGITKIKGLVALSIENFKKISDYSSLSQLKELESLSICGGIWSTIHVDSLSFLRDMKNLQIFCFLGAILTDKDMSPFLDLVDIKHLTLMGDRETKAIYEQLIKLPKLKYGTIVTRPEWYV